MSLLRQLTGLQDLKCCCHPTGMLPATGRERMSSPD
jgi:hypothetical protein